jgi:hypothetical protein
MKTEGDTLAFRKRSKFGVSVTKKGKEDRTYEGVLFDSLLELRIYRDYLLPLKAQGDIVSIELQKEYVLQKGFTKNGKKILPIKYIADYVITFSNRVVEVWEAKGNATTDATMKRKMFDYVYPELTLRWMTLSQIDGGLVEYDVVKKNRAIRKKEKKNGDKQ